MNQISGALLRVCDCGCTEVGQDGQRTITDLTKAYCVGCGEPVLPPGNYIHLKPGESWPPKPH